MNDIPSKKKILVIDDDPDILDLIKWPLLASYDVSTATDGHHALQSVEQNKPDLLIVDLMMPRLNGWKFCQFLRQDKKYAAYKNIPIIVLSALIGEEGPANRLELADFYMAKPFDTAKLKSKIVELLKDF